MARQLIGRGYTTVYALKGGWIEWQGAGFPMEKK
jgi:rhodanese-related sulfurtransferase